jgi:hypothetical protein
VDTHLVEWVQVITTEETNTMNYTAPSIISSFNAGSTIYGNPKGQAGMDNNDPGSPDQTHQTLGAYEVDE